MQHNAAECGGNSCAHARGKPSYPPPSLIESRHSPRPTPSRTPSRHSRERGNPGGAERGNPTPSHVIPAPSHVIPAKAGISAGRTRKPRRRGTREPRRAAGNPNAHDLRQAPQSPHGDTP